MSLSVFHKTYGIFRAIHVARTGNAAFTEIGYNIIRLYAGCAGLINHSKDGFVMFPFVPGLVWRNRKVVSVHLLHPQLDNQELEAFCI